MTIKHLCHNYEQQNIMPPSKNYKPSLYHGIERRGKFPTGYWFVMCNFQPDTCLSCMKFSYPPTVRFHTDVFHMPSIFHGAQYAENLTYHFNNLVTLNSRYKTKI